MAETSHKKVEEEGGSAGAAGKRGSAGAAAREKGEARQKKKGRPVQCVDEMKVTEFKDALRKLDLSTTGNKAELQTRLLKARAKQQRQEAKDDEISDDAAENESVASDSATESDDASSDEETNDKKRWMTKMEGSRTNIDQYSKAK